MSREIDAKAYILWGGQYDVRELELIEYQGMFQYDDMTGGYVTIHDYTEPRPTKEQAKADLMKYVFDLGEPTSYIDFGPEGIERSPKQ